MATYVELSTRISTRAMESYDNIHKSVLVDTPQTGGTIYHTNQLMPHQILSVLNTLRDSECDLSSVRNHAVHSPLLSTGRKSVFVDLEPFQTCDVRLGGIIDFETLS